MSLDWTDLICDPSVLTYDLIVACCILYVACIHHRAPLLNRSGVLVVHASANVHNAGEYDKYCA